MGDHVRVEVTGLRELRREIRAVRDKELTRELKGVYRDTAAIVATPAQADAPRRSGRLARSVTPAPSTTAAVVRAGRRGSVPYAGAIHFGWRRRRIPPNPFLFRAAGREHPRYAAVFRERITALIRRHLDSR
ncbi:hypothetical protein JOD54_000832 [Actinokineospora baliensis]|uniref:hypothetical protein n=1 Tax=Actinokineospora baliensis TaxID=547056 RepID=UPI00195AC752|nr:hypothetical protein [Actinokineospora baliensis]MBM7770628.1 hypothetical protein [Actinokineospora baliensis]